MLKIDYLNDCYLLSKFESQMKYKSLRTNKLQNLNWITSIELQDMIQVYVLAEWNYTMEKNITK